MNTLLIGTYGCSRVHRSHSGRHSGNRSHHREHSSLDNCYTLRQHKDYVVDLPGYINKENFSPTFCIFIIIIYLQNYEKQTWKPKHEK